MNDLAIVCPGCNHTANYHLSAKIQSMNVLRTGGRYPGECKGAQRGMGIEHCRCITTREEVIEAGKAS